MNLGVAKILARFGFLLTPVLDLPATWEKLRPIITEHQLVRVGSREGDGGYLLPDVFSGVDGVFSAGISDNVDFELELAEALGVLVRCMDASIASLPKNHPNLILESKFVGALERGLYTTLDHWINAGSELEANMILKLDIEGFEYESVLATSPETFKRFRIMVFELHSLEQIVTRLGARLFENFVDRITENHTVVHAHANNVGGEWHFPSGRLPAGLEVTLLRNDSFTSTKGFEALPHILDRKCIAPLPEVVASWPKSKN